MVRSNHVATLICERTGEQSQSCPLGIGTVGSHASNALNPSHVEPCPISGVHKWSHAATCICRRAREYLFVGRYDERILAPINTAMKDYARLLEIDDDDWVVDPSDARYGRETGFCLSDGGLHSGVYGKHVSR